MDAILLKVQSNWISLVQLLNGSSPATKIAFWIMLVVGAVYGVTSIWDIFRKNSPFFTLFVGVLVWTIALVILWLIPPIPPEVVSGMTLVAGVYLSFILVGIAGYFACRYYRASRRTLKSHNTDD